MADKLLIIFAKNPVLGKVKTRLAKEIGDNNALDIYQQLLDFTLTESTKVMSDKKLYFSDFVDENKKIPHLSYALQKGKDLGERMKNAFSEGFKAGYGRIVLIGSDSFEIDQDDIRKAFMYLNEKDSVIGPSTDGSYYLIGLKAPFEPIFSDKPWSTNVVFKRTYLELILFNKTISLLEEKSSIVTPEDWTKYQNKLKNTSSSAQYE
jgi:rSAM/selenodomain-associated transferase 1